MRILIVDDDQLLGHMLAEQLRRHEPPFIADTATTTAEARRMVKEATASFDVMLIDQQLAGSDVDGVTLMQELRLISGQSDFVIFTGYDDTNAGIRAYEAGAYRYIVKPFDMRELILILIGLAQMRQVQRERNWLQILADIAIHLQKNSTVAEVADEIAEGALRLGFERVRLWKWVEESLASPNLLCIKQIGHPGIETLEGTKIPLAEFPYYQKVLNSNLPEIYLDQSLGQGELDRRFPGVFRSPQGEWIALPLRENEQIIGTLSLDNVERPRTLAPDQRDLLRIFGVLVSAALSRVIQQEREVLEAMEHKTLSQIGQWVTKKAVTSKLDDLLETVRIQIGRFMDVDNCIIALIDIDSTLLDIRLHYEAGIRKPRKWWERNNGLIGHLIERNEPLWLPDGTEMQYRMQEEVLPCGEMSRCWLGIPLRIGTNDAIGALVLQDYESPRIYDHRHKDLLIALADQFAGAIELANQREREQTLSRRKEFLNKVNGNLKHFLQEREDWFWHLVLKFVSDDCGLRFNRAMVFVAEDENAFLFHGRLGIGHFDIDDAHRAWESLENRENNTAAKQCDLERFVDHLHLRQDHQRTPIEQEIVNWSIVVDATLLAHLRESGKAACLGVDVLSSSLPDHYLSTFRETSVNTCVVAPLMANGLLRGILIADNVFNGEPVRQEILSDLDTLLRHAMEEWEVWSQNRQELTAKVRKQLAKVRSLALERMNQEDTLKPALNVICEEARILLGADSVVLYPLNADGASYMTGSIAYAGIDPAILQKVTSVRPRQHGLNAHIKRSGEVFVSDITTSLLSFDGVPLQKHGFIRDNNVNSFLGLAIRSQGTNDPLGILYINYQVKEGFTKREENLATEIADIASLVISTAHGSEYLTHQRRSQELNRLRYILEAALSPDADDAKVIKALLANVQELLPRCESVELLIVEWAEGKVIDSGRWIIYRNQSGEPPFISHYDDLACDSFAMHVFTSTVKENQQSVFTAESLPLNVYADLRAQGITSVIGAPIYHNKKVIGVLKAIAKEANVFEERERSRFAELASAAGLVIGNQRRRQGLLSSVLRAAEEVTRPTSLPDTLKAVVDSSFIAAQGIDCVTVWYLKHGSDELMAGPQERLIKQKRRRGGNVDSELVRSVMDSPKVLWASDVRKNQVFKKSRFIKRENIVSTVAFPLKVDNIVVGALFFNYRSLHEFTREEKEALPIFAAIAAAAIQDAQLRHVAERGQKRLEAALTVAKAAGADWERQEVLPAILTALREHFSSYGTESSPYLLTYNAAMKVLELPEEVREFYPSASRDYGLVQIPLDAPRIVARVARDCLIAQRGIVSNIADVANQDNYAPPDSTTKSELCSGLWRNGVLLGTLVLKSPKIGAFSKEDEDLFALVAEQVSAAIERADRVAEKRVDDYLTGATSWAADLAHDINVDVGYIRNRAYWLREREPGISKQGKQWAKEIDERAGELATKARDERSERAKTSIDLGQFLEEKTRKWQVRACPSTIITYEWDSNPVYVSVYPEQVWRSVRHLLRNAIEAMDYRGHLWLRMKEVGQDTVELQVENSGKDLSLEARQRIFREPYSSKVGDEKGGMGLLIAKKLIEQMGGSIHLLPPSPGYGPIFAVTLPCTDEPGGAS